MAPEASQAGCASLRHGAPWPNLPADIAYASLPFSAGDLLKAPSAAKSDLPSSLLMAGYKRRADYIAGRLCAHSALERLGGKDLHVGRLENGAPLWPAGFCGSISHTQGCAVAVVALTDRYRSLGIDVENILSPAQAHRLSRMILTRSEIDRFQDHPPCLATTVVFSIKEALFKLLHPLTGVMFYHEQAEVISLHGSGWARLRLLDTLSAQWPEGTVLSARWKALGGRVHSMLISPRPYAEPLSKIDQSCASRAATRLTRE